MGGREIWQGPWGKHLHSRIPPESRQNPARMFSRGDFFFSGVRNLNARNTGKRCTGTIPGPRGCVDCQIPGCRCWLLCSVTSLRQQALLCVNGRPSPLRLECTNTDRNVTGTTNTRHERYSSSCFPRVRVGSECAGPGLSPIGFSRRPTRPDSCFPG